MANRLDAVSEEVVLTLLGEYDSTFRDGETSTRLGAP